MHLLLELCFLGFNFCEVVGEDDAHVFERYFDGLVPDLLPGYGDTKFSDETGNNLQVDALLEEEVFFKFEVFECELSF
jgi:hypothetical protein